MQLKSFLSAGTSSFSLALGLTALIIPATVNAQSTGSVDFEESVIVVTGSTQNRGVEGILVPDTSKAKQVMTQDQLARGTPGQSVLDSINKIPGVSFTNNDAYGSAGGQLFIRGFSSDRISLTFDGIPLNDSGNYAIFSQQQLDPELIEQVNVNLGSTDVDSPTAAATGSTVNYRTRLPRKETGFRISASGGEYNFIRIFGAFDTGEIGPWGTRAFLAMSKANNDNPYNNYGKIDKTQYNGRIYQPIGSNGDFVSVSGNFNRNRNNFFGSVPLRTDLPRVVSSLATGRFPLNNDERQYNIVLGCTLNQAAVRETGAQVAATGYVDPDGANTCATEFDRRYNPSDTGNIRGASKFSLTDALTLTVDPSYQWVLANGGGTVTARENGRDINPAGATAGSTNTANCTSVTTGTGVNCVAGYIGGSPFFLRDMNGDGDLLDTFTALAPSNTRTKRLGVIANLRWDINDDHSIRVAYSLDRARHRQTGEVSLLNPNGEPIDVFGLEIAQADANGVTLQKRDRLSYAILHQFSGEYTGRFFDDALTVNAGLRAPFFTRDLNNYCFTTSDSGFVDCFGQGNALNATYATLNPTFQGPQQRILKYDDILPNVGIVYRLDNPLSFFGNYSKGLQVPGTDALYNAFFFAANTPSAQPAPETTDNFDAGVRWTDRRIQAQLVGWFTKYQNRLASAYDPVTDRNVYRNLGAVEKYGIDGSIAFKPIDSLLFYVFGSWFESKIKDDVQSGECLAAQVTNRIFGCTTIGQPLFVATAGNRESGAPEYTYGAEVRAMLGPIDFGFNAKRFGGRYLYDSNLPFFGGTWSSSIVNGQPVVANNTFVAYEAKTPAYWLVNLDARINLEWAGINDKTYLQLNVYNLFDQLYVGNFNSGLNQGNVIGAGQFGGNPGAAPNAQIGAPRTISATINVEF